MATLYITEFALSSFVPSGGPLPIAAMPPAAEQTEAITGGSTQTDAVGTQTKVIRVHTDAICSIAIGANPTAAATNMRLPANHTEYFAVTPGHKLAVISNT